MSSVPPWSIASGRSLPRRQRTEFELGDSMEPAEEQDVVRGLLQGNAESWQGCMTLMRRAYGVSWHGSWDRAVPRLPMSSKNFLAAARSARSYDASRGSIWVWLCGIARNQVALHFRKHQRHQRLQQAIAWLAASEGMSRWLVCDIPTPTEMFASSESRCSCVRHCRRCLPTMNFC